MSNTHKPHLKPNKKTTSNSSFLDNINPKFLTPIFISVILILLLVFFGGVIFSGKLFSASDNISWESFQPYLQSLKAKGEMPLWLPHIFSGLPGFAALLVTGDRWWDLGVKLLTTFESIFGVINHDVMRVVFHYFVYGTGMFLLMRSKKANHLTSLITSIAAVFSTWIIVYIMIGHNTKIWALMAFPYVYLCLEKLIDKWSWLYAGLLILAVHIMWESTHLQTVFYGACALGIYLLFELISAIRNKGGDKSRLNGVIRAAILLAVAGGLTYGMGLDRNLSVQEYLKYSTRGAKSIVENPNDKLTEDGGHGYDYATGWSFSPSETITYLIPSYYGFGNVVKDGKKDNFYWGQMAFTDAGHYAGIAVLLLACIGFWANKKNPLVQSLFAIGMFGLILSYGKNMSFLYDLFYNYFPSFNKFRAPSQSLLLLEFVLPILAGFGIKSVLEINKSSEENQGINFSTIMKICIGFSAVLILASTVNLIGDYKSSVVSSIKEKFKAEQYSPEQISGYADSIYEGANSLMKTDTFFAFLFTGVTILILFMYSNGKLKQFTFLVLLLLIITIDLWRVSSRPMESQTREEAMAPFQQTDIDDYLLKDKSLFRIMDLTTQANYVAHRQMDHILGYHAAKMRSYQDLLDICGNGNVITAPQAWNMLNTKYIINKEKMPGMENYKEVYTSQITGGKVFENPNSMPRAWFVNSIKPGEPKEILENIKNSKFDPYDIAYVDKSFNGNVESSGYNNSLTIKQNSDSTIDSINATEVKDNSIKSTVNITKYEPNHITLEANAIGNNFLVLSEMYYQPIWKATIDGNPSEIIRTNYLMRGIIVPKGKHIIQLDCISESINLGKWVSLAINIIMFGMIGYGLMQNRKLKPIQDDLTHS